MHVLFGDEIHKKQCCLAPWISICEWDFTAFHWILTLHHSAHEAIRTSQVFECSAWVIQTTFITLFLVFMWAWQSRCWQNLFYTAWTSTDFHIHGMESSTPNFSFLDFRLTTVYKCMHKPEDVSTTPAEIRILPWPLEKADLKKITSPLPEIPIRSPPTSFLTELKAFLLENKKLQRVQEYDSIPWRTENCFEGEVWLLLISAFKRINSTP